MNIVYVIIVYGFLHNQIGTMTPSYSDLQSCQLALAQKHFDIGYWGQCTAVNVPPPLSKRGE